MILEFDLGNTRAKWRVVTPAGVTVASASGDIDKWLAGDVPSEWLERVERVRIASVRNAHILDRLVEMLRQHIGVSAEVAAVANVCGGVRNGYLLPASLGVDRWLAMIAAVAETGDAVLVVDAGSALTIDLVDGAGDHRGGFIIPGPRLMREVLTAATDRIRFEAQELKASLVFGQSTADCVLNGAMLAVVGSIQLSLVNAERLLGAAPAMFLTGGYAELLMSVSALDGVRHRPDLVMDGLRHALP